ncbi:inheritance of peroxisomes protein 1-domain-containing protein [Paraphoma chrysanthemicola]|uniref:Inheritance of peroxisomes protein 1 n=1 Tax=Paraphoma chrysanthemicola TaxID=798071 RepID=A0A8K0RB15_9PLEO|nr:inheritance of peroxisomes protein 1-domain-containing protein [Paraphoma chrysanthemicola]
MAFPASSNTPEHAPHASTHARRSFTLPARPTVRSASTPASRNTSTSDGIETLFTCTTSKIVSFTAAGPSKRHSPSRSPRRRGSPPRSIPWTSPTERTLAVGALRIYRVTASNVSFLNSGNFLHTIFPRSQCWCVDGQSVFVLRVRQDTYYRIELPYDTEEDREAISEFRSVLSQVLQYEKTQNPFSRSSNVELLDRPKTPPRKLPHRQPTQKAKKWVLDKTWVPQNGARPSTPVFDVTESPEVASNASSTARETVIPRPARRLSFAERVSMFQGPRSVTAPVTTERNISAVSMARIPESIPESPRTEDTQAEPQKPVLERHVSEADSLASSADSFYSVGSAPFASPSPDFVDAERNVSNPWADMTPKQQNEKRGRSTHRRQISELTVRASSAEIGAAPVTPTFPFHRTTTPTIDVQPSSAPSTPPLVSDSDDDSEDISGLDAVTPPDAIRMKRLTGASQRRAFSPMPQPKSLFVPRRPSFGAQFTSALVRKTCELVLGPPAHLVSLMLRIAASISNGFGWSTARVRKEEKIPCSWESDEENEWPEEDDFGIPLTNLGDHAERRRAFLGDLD